MCGRFCLTCGSHATRQEPSKSCSFLLSHHHPCTKEEEMRTGTNKLKYEYQSKQASVKRENELSADVS